MLALEVKKPVPTTGLAYIIIIIVELEPFYLSFPYMDEALLEL